MPAILPLMHATKYIMWEEEGRWHGHLKDHPDILAQAESFEDLQIKLCSLHRDLTTGPSDRRSSSPPPKPYPMPRRITTNTRLERLLSSMVNDL
ncbi:MAG: hypothetical protein NNA22_09085 [Nitrospira sp.]|nr:hypothetical protein [Nitrospira sp.]